MTGDYVRLDVLGDGLIDVALRKLAVAETGAVPDQFVRKRTAYAREDEVPDRVFEDRAVADFLDVAQLRRVAAGPWLGK